MTVTVENTATLCPARHTDHMVGVKDCAEGEFEGLPHFLIQGMLLFAK